MPLSKGFVIGANTTPLDARLFEQALLTKNANDVPRSGVLYGALGPLATTSGMSLTIPDQVVFAISRGKSDGCNITLMSGAYTVPIAAAPGANSRIDGIYIKHGDTSQGDADSNPFIGVVQGDAAASPSMKALPAGATLIGTLQITAGVTATNAATGVTLTNTMLGTSLLGTPIRYRSVTEMNADAGNVIDGTLGYVKGGELYWLRGGAWSAVTGDTGWIGFIPANGYTGSSNLAYRRIGSVVYLRGQISPNSGNIGAATLATIPTNFAPAQNTALVALGGGAAIAKMLVNADGTIVSGAPSASTTYLRLDGMVYPNN